MHDEIEAHLGGVPDLEPTNGQGIRSLTTGWHSPHAAQATRATEAVPVSHALDGWPLPAD